MRFLLYVLLIIALPACDLDYLFDLGAQKKAIKGLVKKFSSLTDGAPKKEEKPAPPSNEGSGPAPSFTPPNPAPTTEQPSREPNVTEEHHHHYNYYTTNNPPPVINSGGGMVPPPPGTGHVLPPPPPINNYSFSSGNNYRPDIATTTSLKWVDLIKKPDLSIDDILKETMIANSEGARVSGDVYWVNLFKGHNFSTLAGSSYTIKETLKKEPFKNKTETQQAVELFKLVFGLEDAPNSVKQNVYEGKGLHILAQIYANAPPEGKKSIVTALRNQDLLDELAQNLAQGDLPKDASGNNIELNQEGQRIEWNIEACQVLLYALLTAKGTSSKPLNKDFKFKNEHPKVKTGYERN